MPPILFNTAIRDMRRQRAHAIGFADFLHVEAVELIQERLEEVNRQFTDCAIVTHAPEVWRELRPGAQIVSDNDTLDLTENSLDLTIHGLALHGANDPVGQLIQLNRALKPDGMMMAVLFGGQTLHELRSSLAEAEIETRGGLSPRVAPMSEIRDIAALLQRAGFAIPVADNITLKVSYDSAIDLMRDLRRMGETNSLDAQDRATLRRDLLTRACEIYQDNYSNEDGRIIATFELIFLTGWAPSANQQKPLKPGSARTRLSDALNTTELPAGQTAGED